ncbi:MAG: mechanosensitive ion channel family protein, partial [Bryobacterales bacterium]|nr:mechanosensitive ion channel family protein [Bryobacterales bacterium]
ASGHTRLHDNLVTVLGRLTVATSSLIGLAVAAVVVFPTFRPGDLISGLGITSVAIGFAFKDILQNFFAGILILWRQPFRIGDQIRSGEWEGTVEDINTWSTRLLTFDGQRAVLANGEVYTRAILVHTANPSRRIRLNVTLPKPESLEEARRLILDLLSKTEGVHPEPGPWVYIDDLATAPVNLRVYFWTGSKHATALAVTDRVASRIKQALHQAGLLSP